MTTGDAAQMLGLTRNGVRYLVREGQLPCERTAKGWRLFRRRDVRQCGVVRLDARARTRDAQLRAVRVRMLKAGYEPRQLKLFSPLRLVHSRPTGERSLHPGEVKAAQSLTKSGESENLSYVDQKVAVSR